MKKQFLKLGLLGIFLWGGMIPNTVFAQSSYSDYDALTNRLRSLNSNYGNLTELTSLAKTGDGRDVWVLTIGSGDVKNNPAIAVIGGAQGSHILGSELALSFAEKLLASSSEDDTKNLLASTTFYVLPRINPDATEQYFARLKYERNGNARSTDDDRDGEMNEDPYDDLNGDGLITMMRVEDATGEWMTLKDDARVMIKADIDKGEKGNYLLLTEGRDNDDDGAFNEDGEGGVDMNMNFTFDYPYFQPGAGDNPAYEVEIRGVLDFLFEEARNTFAVVSFGPENNLDTPVRFNAAANRRRVVASWYNDDVSINKLISDMYKKETKLGKAPAGPAQKGDLFQWAYYHYGRLSFSTPGWWAPEVKDENGKAKKISNTDAKYLAWADAEGLNSFVEWTEIDHPDFPGKKVEVGGIKPFAKTTPPYELVDSLATSHTNFIVKVAEMRPQVKLLNFKTESAGKNLTRISVDVYNEGVLPTTSRLGRRTSWVRKVTVDMELSNNLSMVSGRKLSYENVIPGDGFATHTWLVSGKGSFKLTAGSPVTGFSIIEERIR